MKVAVIGSRGLLIEDLGRYLPAGVTELVSGGARGVDSCARAYATTAGIQLTEFLPQYQRFGRAAPLRRNEEIVAYADCVIAFWDGTSKGTKQVIEICQKSNKPFAVYQINL